MKSFLIAITLAVVAGLGVMALNKGKNLKRKILKLRKIYWFLKQNWCPKCFS